MNFAPNEPRAGSLALAARRRRAIFNSHFCPGKSGNESDVADTSSVGSQSEFPRDLHAISVGK